MEPRFTAWNRGFRSAAGGRRTPTSLRTRRPERRASTSSATAACGHQIYRLPHGESRALVYARHVGTPRKAVVVGVAASVLGLCLAGIALAGFKPAVSYP